MLLVLYERCCRYLQQCVVDELPKPGFEFLAGPHTHGAHRIERATTCEQLASNRQQRVAPVKCGP
jgi:hypothetical protein